MAFTLQLDDGSVDDANAYVDEVTFKAYHDDRGNDYSAFTDDQIKEAVVKATDYIDHRFNPAFISTKLGATQGTSWPRVKYKDRDGFDVEGLPRELLWATHEYTFRALSAALAPDPVVDETGQTVRRKLERVEGAITKEVEYGGGGEDAITFRRFKPYPKADAIIANLLKPGGRVVRA